VVAVSGALVWGGVLLAGGAGAVLRFLVDAGVSQRAASDFPAGTLVVNVSGAFVLGLLSGIVLSPDAALVVATGLIGSYTTFSTWMFETQRLGEGRQHRFAWANILVSLAVGLALAGSGLWLGEQL
jgi:CrcB protein